MLRKLAYAVVVAGVSVGFAMAQNPVQPGGPGGVKNQPMWGKITKINNNQISFEPWDPTTKKFGTVKTYPVTADQVKIFEWENNKFNPVNDGLKNKLFTNIPEAGLYGNLQLEGNNVNQIRVFTNQDAWMQNMKSSTTPVPPPPGK